MNLAFAFWLLQGILLQNTPDLTAIRESSPVVYTIAVLLLAGLVVMYRMYAAKDKRVDELQEKRVAEAMEALVITKDATTVVQELTQLINQLLEKSTADAGVKAEVEKLVGLLSQFNADVSNKFASVEQLIRDSRGGT